MARSNLQPTVARNFSLLIKPVSETCNLDCAYCFYHHRPDDPYKDVTGRKLMSDEGLRDVMRQYCALPVQPAIYCWQGGEPLVAGHEFFERVFEYEAALGGHGRVVSNAVQTNGVLLDDRFAEMFARFKVLVGLSVDGPASVHDKYRVDYQGKGTHAAAMRAAETMRRHAVEFNALSVVTPAAADRAKEIYEWFVRNGFRHLQFIPNVEHEHDTGEIRPLSVSAKQYGRFLCEIFDLWYGDGNPTVCVRLFDNVMEGLLGRRPTSCAMSTNCADYIVVEYNGDVYPCDFLVNKDWFLGNLMETPLPAILRSKRWLEFLEIKPRLPRPCRKCKYLAVCRGGCPYDRWMAGNFLRPPHLCEAYKNFYDHAVPRLRKLLKRLKLDQAHGA